MTATIDWGAWSRGAVALMATRTRALLARHGVAMGSAYAWHLDAAEIAIGGVRFRLVTVGTVADDSFLWAWANDALPARCRDGIDEVRRFGAEHDLGLLTEPCAPGGLSQGKECLAIAGRVLDAHGGWIDQTDAGFILFVLFDATAAA